MLQATAGFTAALVFLLPCLGSAQDKACEPTVTGHLDILPLTSNIFHNKRSLRVWLPPGYDDTANAQKKYKVLYVLDGQDAFDKCTSSGQNMELRADEALTGLIEGGKIGPIIAVGVDSPSASSQRAREFLPYPDPTVWFDVGTVQDVPVKGVAALADNFKAIAVFPPQVQFTIGEGDRHNPADFGKRLPAALLFLYGSQAAK